MTIFDKPVSSKGAGPGGQRPNGECLYWRMRDGESN